MKSILLIGGTGLLGPYLMNQFKNDFILYEASRQSLDYVCDLNNKEEIKVMIKKINPDIVIYLAGITNINVCEENLKLANNINHLGAKYIKKYLSLKQKIIYIGNNYRQKI